MSAYDYEPEISNSQFITLDKKDDEVTIRLVSDPAHQRKHWVVGDDGKKRPINCGDKRSDEDRKKKVGKNNCPLCGDDLPPKDRMKTQTLFAWVVLDRSDSQVKVFQTYSALDIYVAIKKLALDDAWGDPKQYDLKVKRTEGRPYYSVLPLPNKGDITAEEKEAVANAAIDINEEVRKEPEGYGLGDDGDLETVSPKKESAVDDEDLELF